MKRVSLLLVILALVTFMAGIVSAAPKVKCATIQSSVLYDSAGNLLTTGYDKWGYNYQAHMFNGLYGNYSRPATPVNEGDSLQMKWNDAWLSNSDCDGDGKLDRHYGYPAYQGSGAWLTNHMAGTYEDNSGKSCKWTYFVKIVAAPLDATKENGTWITSGGVEIGPVLWGEFAVIQEVSNDKCAGENGLFYKSPASPGFGAYKP
jgi:hypothetical protein